MSNNEDIKINNFIVLKCQTNDVEVSHHQLIVASINPILIIKNNYSYSHIKSIC